MAGRRPELIGAALALLVATAPAGAQTSDWRRVATREDRARLREWRTAWLKALGSQQPGDMLLDPDQALSGAMPPVGRYRCRRLRLGGGEVRAWVPCAITSAGGDVRQLTIDRGTGQRPDGLLYSVTDARAVFLGTWRMSDEQHAIAYGRDGRRDLPGWMERVGPARWRLALPYPGFGAVMELVELVPLAADGAG